MAAGGFAPIRRRDRQQPYIQHRLRRALSQRVRCCLIRGKSDDTYHLFIEQWSAAHGPIEIHCPGYSCDSNFLRRDAIFLIIDGSSLRLEFRQCDSEIVVSDRPVFEGISVDNADPSWCVLVLVARCLSLPADPGGVQEDYKVTISPISVATAVTKCVAHDCNNTLFIREAQDRDDESSIALWNRIQTIGRLSVRAGVAFVKFGNRNMFEIPTDLRVIQLAPGASGRIASPVLHRQRRTRYRLEWNGGI